MIERGVLAAALGIMAPAMAHAQTTPQTTPPAKTAPAAPSTAPDDAQIIPDAEFNKALPPLSNDINAPLEPMPTMAPTPPPPVPQAQPPVLNSAAPGSTVSTNPNAPFPPAGPEDAALAQPLVPLAQFNSQPVNTATNPASESAARITYTTVVNGLEPVGLSNRFHALSALRHAKGHATTAAQVAARAHEDELLAVRLMHAAGYYDGTATSRIEQIPNVTGQVRAVIDAVPGKLYHLGSVAIEAQATVPPDLIRSNLPLAVGDPIEAERVQGAEANVALKLPQNGYPFAKVGQRDILLDDTAFTGAYTLPVDTGVRASFGTVTSDALVPPKDAIGNSRGRPTKKKRGGGMAFSAEHVRVLTRFKQGDLWDSRKIDDLRQALIATGLFRTVAVEPVKTGQPGPDGTQYVDVAVHQQAGPARTLAASAGYGTGEGLRIEGSWTHRNLFRPEGALILRGIAGTQEQGIFATFRRQNAGQRDRTVQAILSADHSHYTAFDADTITASFRISRDSTPIWQKTLTYSYGLDLLGTNERVYNFAKGMTERGTYFVAALPGQVTFDRSNDLLNPTKGYRVKLTLSPESSVRGSFRPYGRTMAEVDGYFPFGQSIVLAGRARAGSIFGIARNELAPSRRYYGGGGGSVRGYSYQALGPRDPDGNPVGGRSLNEFSLEVRYRFGNYGIVPFIDGGQTYESVFPSGKDMRYGVGIGGRFYTNFGPLRVDLATPLNRRKGDPKIAAYISIGQAF